MQFKKLKKVSYNASGPNKIRTLFYTFSLLAANALSPQALIAQEKTSSEEVEIGYGTVKKNNLTGSLTEVNVNDITKAPVYSFTEALGGRAAGLQVSASDGQPGAAMNILIRSISSLFQHNAPLFVIDGTIVPDFQAASLNPEEIETLNILKDAAATAIYGANATHGVVLIKTKRGQEGRPVITFNNALGFQQVTKKMELMSPYEFVKYQVELDPVGASTKYFGNGKTLASYQNEEGVDWQDLIFRRSLVRMHNLALRGGSSKNRYAFSGSNFDQQGVLANSGAKKYQGRVAVDQVITDKLTIGINANYSMLSNSGQIASEGSMGGYYSYLNNRVWSYRPTSGNDFDLVNSEIDVDASKGYLKRLNPVITNENEDRKYETSDLLGSAYINYDIIDGLTFRSIGSYINRVHRRSRFNNSKTYLASPMGPLTARDGINGSFYKYNRSHWLSDNTLTYEKILAGDHHLSVLGGFSKGGDHYDVDSVSFVYIPHNDAALEEGTESGYTSQMLKDKSKSYFGRFFYGYRSRYLIEGNYRADKKYEKVDHYTAVAVAWNMHEESFLKNSTMVSVSKLRLSYGKQQGRRIGDQYNIGYDLGLFNNRVALTVDAYKKTIENRAVNNWSSFRNNDGVFLSTIGFNNFISDKIQNKGLEFNLNTINIQSASFSWSTNFNIDFNDNKILNLSNSPYAHMSFPAINIGMNYPLYQARVGHSSGAMHGLIFDGVYQYADFNRSGSGAYILKENVPHYNSSNGQIQPGDIKYKDVNGDGFLNTDDAVAIGSGLPLHTGGFNNNFTYKNFDLNIFFQWSYGNDIYNANRLFLEGNAGGYWDMNQFASYANRWTPENQTNENYRAGGAREYFHSSRVVEDGSYLRLKTASLSYNVSAKHVTKLHLSKLQFHITAQNLLTFTKYSGMDPEVSVMNNVLSPGLDLSAYPQARTLMFGINASF